jgi:hypothetical protein
MGDWMLKTNLLARTMRQSALELQEGTGDLVTESCLPLLVVDDSLAAKDTMAASGGGSGGVSVVASERHVEGSVWLFES